MLRVRNKTGVKTRFRRLIKPWKGQIENWERETGRKLQVLVTYVRHGAKRAYSGVCNYKRNRIRVSINPYVKYPLTIRVGNPFKEPEFKLIVRSAEVLVAFLFLHEISHLLDRVAGIPTRNKQTKADKVAVNRLLRLGIIGRADIIDRE